MPDSFSSIVTAELAYYCVPDVLLTAAIFISFCLCS